MEGPPSRPATELTGLHVVGVRYRNSAYAVDDERALDAYARSGVYDSLTIPVTVAEPRLADNERSGSEPRDVGLLCGEVAREVARGVAAGKGVLLVGGNCVHATGVVGGLQDVWGPASRVGLVWFDAHGDFNTPSTSESGSLGGMPLAVVAGLAHPEWRELSHVRCPLPAYRILLVGARNLDEAESRLIRAAGVAVAGWAPDGRESGSLEACVASLESLCDHIYVHIDCDVLDESYVPNHRTKVSNGPAIAHVVDAVGRVMASGKVAAFAVVSVSGAGPGHDISVSSAVQLIRAGLACWRTHGFPGARPA